MEKSEAKINFFDNPHYVGLISRYLAPDVSVNPNFTVKTDFDDSFLNLRQVNKSCQFACDMNFDVPWYFKFCADIVEAFDLFIINHGHKGAFAVVTKQGISMYLSTIMLENRPFDWFLLMGIIAKILWLLCDIRSVIVPSQLFYDNRRYPGYKYVGEIFTPYANAMPRAATITNASWDVHWPDFDYEFTTGKNMIKDESNFDTNVYGILRASATNREAWHITIREDKIRTFCFSSNIFLASGPTVLKFLEYVTVKTEDMSFMAPILALPTNSYGIMVGGDMRDYRRRGTTIRNMSLSSFMFSRNDLPVYSMLPPFDARDYTPFYSLTEPIYTRILRVMGWIAPVPMKLCGAHEDRCSHKCACHHLVNSYLLRCELQNLAKFNNFDPVCCNSAYMFGFKTYLSTLNTDERLKPGRLVAMYNAIINTVDEIDIEDVQGF